MSRTISAAMCGAAQGAIISRGIITNDALIIVAGVTGWLAFMVYMWVRNEE